MAKVNTNQKKLSAQQAQEILKLLNSRFEKNKKLHKGMEWDKIKSKLLANQEKLWSREMLRLTLGSLKSMSK